MITQHLPVLKVDEAGHPFVSAAASHGAHAARVQRGNDVKDTEVDSPHASVQRRARFALAGLCPAGGAAVWTGLVWHTAQYCPFRVSALSTHYGGACAYRHAKVGRRPFHEHGRVLRTNPPPLLESVVLGHRTESNVVWHKLALDDRSALIG